VRKIYLILGAVFLAVLIMPKKINEVFKNVVELVSSNYNSAIDAVLARLDVKLSPIEKQLFKKRITAIITTESKGNAAVKNGSAGEIGVMQIKPAVAASVAKMYGVKVYDLKNTTDNILVGTLLLYDNYIKSSRDLDWATQRYNQGWVDKTNLLSLAYLSKVKGYENYV
jgi:soluble lytic murein transglycosylase-like protein